MAIEGLHPTFCKWIWPIYFPCRQKCLNLVIVKIRWNSTLTLENGLKRLFVIVYLLKTYNRQTDNYNVHVTEYAFCYVPSNWLFVRE